MIPKLHNFDAASLPFLLNLYDFAEQYLSSKMMCDLSDEIGVAKADID